MSRVVRNVVAFGTGVATSVGTGIATAAPLASTDFGTIQADITGTIAVAAGIGVAIMIVGLGWDVGLGLVRKFAKKGAK